MKSHAALLLIALLPLVMVSCSSTQYTEYRSNEVFHGRGGAVRTISGVEIWTGSGPDRDFKVIGVVDNSTRDIGNHGLLKDLVQGSMQDSTRDGALVSAVKKYRGDAVVIVQQGEKLIGGTSSGAVNYQNYVGGYGSGTYNGNVSVNYSHLTRAFVIKYVDVNK